MALIDNAEYEQAFKMIEAETFNIDFTNVDH